MHTVGVVVVNRRNDLVVEIREPTVLLLNGKAVCHRDVLQVEVCKPHPTRIIPNLNLTRIRYLITQARPPPESTISI